MPDFEDDNLEPTPDAYTDVSGDDFVEPGLIEPEDEISEPAEVEDTDNVEPESANEDPENPDPEPDPNAEPEAETDIDIVEVPDMIPDDLVVPETFEDETAELNWYRDNMGKVYNLFGSEEFKNNLINGYEEHLIAKEKDHEDLKAIKDAFEGNPEAAFKRFLPNALQSRGLNPNFTGEEIEKHIDEKLMEEFGENYKDLMITADLFKPTSMSSQIYERQKELANEFKESAKQALVEQSQQQSGGVDLEAFQKIVDEQYKEHFSGVPAEDFNEFIQEISDREWTLVDYHNAHFFKEHIAEARQEGFDEGRKAVADEIKNAGGRTYNPPVSTDNGNSAIPVNERDYARALNVGQM